MQNALHTRIARGVIPAERYNQPFPLDERGSDSHFFTQSTRPVPKH